MKRTACLLAGLSLAGCDLGPAYHAPALEVPAAFRASDATAAAAWPSDTWWQGFGSPELDSLIVQAKTNNFDIAAAIARVRQADAQVRINSAGLLPTLDGTASATWQHLGLGTGSSSTGGRFGGGNASIDRHSYSVGLSAGYQFDFWGRAQAQRSSAISSAMFSRFDQQTVALTVLTNVANTWFTALALADRLAVAERNVRDAEQTLAVVRGRVAAGTGTALEVAQQEALLAGEQATIPSLRSQLEQGLISLGILVGRPPEAITARPGSLSQLRLPPVYPGLPSALLQRRPDVASAEAQLQAANFDVKAARAAFFPTIGLTSSAGYEAAALNTLISPGSALMSLVGSLTAPLFDGGTLRGQLEQAKGRQQELLADYRKAVVQAFTDVDTALTAWRYTSEQERLQQTAVTTAQRAADIARAQMQAGTVDITTVLTAESTLFNAEDTLAQVRLARFQALLNLYKALGGGWVAPNGALQDQFPGLSPGLLPGAVALPVGGNVR